MWSVDRVLASSSVPPELVRELRREAAALGVGEPEALRLALEAGLRALAAARRPPFPDRIDPPADPRALPENAPSRGPYDDGGSA